MYEVVTTFNSFAIVPILFYQYISSSVDVSKIEKTFTTKFGLTIVMHQ